MLIEKLRSNLRKYVDEAGFTRAEGAVELGRSKKEEPKKEIPKSRGFTMTPEARAAENARLARKKEEPKKEIPKSRGFTRAEGAIELGRGKKEEPNRLDLQDIPKMETATIKDYKAAKRIRRETLFEFEVEDKSAKNLIKMLQRIDLKPLKGEEGVYYLDAHDLIVFFVLYDNDEDGNLELVAEKQLKLSENPKNTIDWIERITLEAAIRNKSTFKITDK